MQNDNELEVIEAIRFMDAGSTKPILCRCNDNELYVIKSTATTSRKELIHEFIASTIAKRIHLPIPNFAITYVPHDIVDYLPPHFNRGLSHGYAFASRYISDSANISFSMAHQMIDVQKQKEIYLFDRIVNNSDRTLSPLGGNVNIIYNIKKQSYYLIDHNLAFASNVVEGEFEYHVFSPKHRDWVYDMFDAISIEDIANVINDICPDILSQLPDDWTGDELNKNEIFANILSTVARGNDESFRSSIK